MIIANDATVKGGTYFPITVKKHLRAQEIAKNLHIPCIYLVDSGGAYLPYQSDIFPDSEHFGRMFYNQAQMSKLGIPQIAVVMGSCTAGGAYIPAMADETIIVKDTGTIFLGGPPLVKAATGEIVSDQELGGAILHCTKSGVADYFATCDRHALDIVRNIISRYNNTNTNTIVQDTTTITTIKHNNTKGLLELLPNDPKKPLDMRKLIEYIIDTDLDEFKSLYGQSIITGFAKIHGKLVGIIANNGILFSQEAIKATHFIQLCCQRQIPLLFFQHVHGFMVGKSYESNGIAKDGAKMVRAISCATVPKITFLCGASYGAGYYAMCGRSFSPTFIFSYPNAQIAVMGSEQATSVLSALDTKLNIQVIHERYTQQSSAFYAASRLWNDAVIDPQQTRELLGILLPLLPKSHANCDFGVLRM